MSPGWPGALLVAGCGWEAPAGFDPSGEKLPLSRALAACVWGEPGAIASLGGQPHVSSMQPKPRANCAAIFDLFDPLMVILSWTRSLFIGCIRGFVF